jgi:intraflagellar transport protein 52
MPFLGLTPAVFPPIAQEPPTPALELFDLDDEFALEKVRLSQCTNKCENKDLEYFVRESSDILGISGKIKNRSNPKGVIKYVLDQIINFKRAVPR